jgi:hypothetical protein
VSYSRSSPQGSLLKAAALRAARARLPEELSVLRVELVSDVIHLARGHSLLHNRRDRPGVADGLGFLDTFLIGDAPIELREREAVSAALPPHRVCGLRRELVGEVVRLVTRQAFS